MHETLTAPRSKNHQIDEVARRYYDTATLIAEALDGVMRSEIPLGYDGHDIYSLKDGTRYGEMLQKSIDHAEHIVEENPNYAFELRRRRLEAEELPVMLNMMDGGGPNTMVVVSDFPPELMAATEDSSGYNARRKQTMLRIVARKPDGSLSVKTQSLDGSNRHALEAIYWHFGVKAEDGELLGQRITADLNLKEQAELCDTLTDVYDQSLAMQTGSQWHAGRKLLPGLKRINTYQFVLEREHILNDYIASDQYGQTRSLRGLIRIFEEQYNQELYGSTRDKVEAVNYQFGNSQVLEAVLQQAAQRADQAGSIYSACGGTMKAENTDFENAGYGNKSKEELSWHGGSVKKGTCVSCKEGPKDVGVASWCKSCIKGHCG
jgi:hypothetical protein